MQILESISCMGHLKCWQDLECGILSRIGKLWLCIRNYKRTQTSWQWVERPILFMYIYSKGWKHKHPNQKHLAMREEAHISYQNLFQRYTGDVGLPTQPKGKNDCQLMLRALAKSDFPSDMETTYFYSICPMQNYIYRRHICTL